MSAERKIPMTDYIVPDDLKPLIPGFLSRRWEEIKQISQFVNTMSFHEISALGHRLKGNGSSYGFHKLSELGADFEAAAHSKDIEKVKVTLSTFEEEVKKISSVFSKK